MSKNKLTIEEQMENFKNHLWKNTKPLDFAAAVVEEMLLEIQRQQTVMACAHAQMTSEGSNVRESTSMSFSQYKNLLESLKSERKGIYPQYLSMQQYDEYIKKSTDFATIARAATLSEEQNINEEEKLSEQSE